METDHPPQSGPREGSLATAPAVTLALTAEGQAAVPAQASEASEVPRATARWCTRDIFAFFVLGITTALPCMLVTTGASDMFTDITGIYGVCLSVSAAVTSFVSPPLLHYLPLNVRMLIATSASVLSLVISTLGTATIAGPAVGTILAGFVYAFGTTIYLAVAAFFDIRTVVSFSAGSGCSAIIGPAIYIGLVQAFHGRWRNVLLVCLPFTIIQPVTWWLVLSRTPRHRAEETRKHTVTRSKKAIDQDDEDDAAPSESVEQREQKGNEGLRASVSEERGQKQDVDSDAQWMQFAGRHTRLGLFGRKLLPGYVIPLFLCTVGAMFNLSGLSATFQQLNTFKRAPEGQLNYQLDFLAYGAAQFLFSTCASFLKLPAIYGWAVVMLTVVAIGIVQLFEPFLTYYGVWVMFMFVTGGVVGGSVANTNHKVADEFEKMNAGDEVRSFAMSYGGLGNFLGDTVGGVLAIVVQKLATAHLTPRGS
ncbi:MAG: hypothetical protein Q9159_000909 [Coniocarpon cinnabarinum]